VWVHNNPSGAELVVVPLSKRELMLRLVHEELGHNTTNTVSEILKGYYWCSHVWRKVSVLARMHGCNAYAVSI
jgi:hypothetical protein